LPLPHVIVLETRQGECLLEAGRLPVIGEMTMQSPSDNIERSTISNGLKYGVAIGSVFMPLLGIIMGIISMTDKDPEKQAAGKLWLGVGGGMMAVSCACSAMFVLVAAMAS
jgi:hypothetical protein